MSRDRRHSRVWIARRAAQKERARLDKEAIAAGWPRHNGGFRPGYLRRLLDQARRVEDPDAILAVDRLIEVTQAISEAHAEQLALHGMLREWDREIAFVDRQRGGRR